MAFALTGLNPIGGQSKKGSNSAMWSYTSADAIAAVNSAGYFNSASQLLAIGDVVFVYDNNTPTMSICIVLSNASGVVDVSDGTTVAQTDSD
jgi:hypothetical protein|tara:strand:- start:63 stop:338 length:276 start_codon:yes stop_codon:yes gene_type:complete